MFEKLRVNERIIALTAALLLSFIVISGFFVFDMKNTLMEDRKEKTRNVVEVAYSVIAHYGALADRKELTEEEAKARALSQLEGLRYNEKDYFWINTEDAHVLMHPFVKKIVGTDASNLKDPTGKRLFAEFGRIGRNGGEGFVDYLWPKPGFDKPVAKISYVKGYAPWDWIVGSGIYVDDVESIFITQLKQIGLQLGIVLAIAIAASLIIGRSITVPLSHMIGTVGKLTQGDFSGKVQTWNSRSEIGVLSQALAIWKQSAISAFQTEVALDNCTTSVLQLDREGHVTYLNAAALSLLGELGLEQDPDMLKGKDLSFMIPDIRTFENTIAHLEGSHTQDLDLNGHALTYTATPVSNAFGERLGTVLEWEDRTEQLLQAAERRAAEQKQLADEKATMEAQKARAEKTSTLLTDHVIGAIRNVVDSTSRMKEEATTMTGISEDSSRKSQVVSSSSQEATHNVEAVAAAAEQISRSIQGIQTEVTNAAATARNAVGEAQTASGAVQGLSEASTQIGAVIDLIQDIAAQTNLLALNATIEAARAGEAGKGFAVVATEVKNLADQTARATGEIASQISGIQSATGDAVKAIELVTEAVSKIDTISSVIAGRVDEQSQATNEISQNALLAANETATVSGNISEIADGSSTIGHAARDVLRASDDLSSIAGNLQAVIETYLQEMNEEDRADKRARSA
ncbi:cache domain-containing protein [Sneathiella chinensis]|uniref:Chemotaxis protein n=1 Tax=Sneathiella chinensis TaxID=349750 RepID=A0ABQ5U0W6_9PROT|nr:cache domain-containing protein [Sneathiella chinensis]GLQ04840.1 chemotaxis protein [Sneathiella chinensis]